jgi:hypothetical protein
LERAVRTASQHSFNQLVFEAEAALAKKEPTSGAQVRAATFELPTEVRAIAAELKDLRQLVGA